MNAEDKARYIRILRRKEAGCDLDSDESQELLALEAELPRTTRQARLDANVAAYEAALAEHLEKPERAIPTFTSGANHLMVGPCWLPVRADWLMLYTPEKGTKILAGDMRTVTMEMPAGSRLGFTSPAAWSVFFPGMNGRQKERVHASEPGIPVTDLAALVKSMGLKLDEVLEPLIDGIDWRSETIVVAWHRSLVETDAKMADKLRSLALKKRIADTPGMRPWPEVA